MANASVSKTKNINLNVIALLLLNDNRIASRIRESGIVFTAKQLASKLPELLPLGNMPLIQLRKSKTGNNYRIPTLYQLDGKVVVIIPDVNASVSEDFTIDRWQAGDVNQAVIISKNTEISLYANIAFTDYSLEAIKQDFNNVDGDDLASLEPTWLKPAPLLELPLYTLPIGTIYNILGISNRRSKKYNTLMVDLEDNNGNVYLNVITNSDLRNLIAEDCKQFKIKSVNTVNVSDHKTAKKETRTIQKVLLEPVISADFSFM